MKYNQNNNKLNLLNKIGKMTCCIMWDSRMHWANQCPHKNNSASTFAAGNNSKTDDENSEKLKWS